MSKFVFSSGSSYIMSLKPFCKDQGGLGWIDWLSGCGEWHSSKYSNITCKECDV